MVNPILDERCNLALTVPREPVGRVVAGGSDAFRLPEPEWPTAGDFEATCGGPTHLGFHSKCGWRDATVDRFRHAFYSRPRIVVYVSGNCVSRFSGKTLTRPSTAQPAKNNHAHQSTSGAFREATTGNSISGTSIRHEPLNRLTYTGRATRDGRT